MEVGWEWNGSGVGVKLGRSWSGVRAVLESWSGGEADWGELVGWSGVRAELSGVGGLDPDLLKESHWHDFLVTRKVTSRRSGIVHRECYTQDTA